MRVPYNELFDQAMTLWDKYALEYRELMPTYAQLIDEKRKLGVEPLWKIKLSDLRSYPKIGLLEAETEAQAEEYLLCLPENELVYEILTINRFIDSRIRRLLKGRICDSRHQIRLSKCPKTPLALDPAYRGRCKVRNRKTRESARSRAKE